MTRLNTQFSVEGISLLNSVMHRPAQFSLNNICSIKSVISLEMKCPQLSKPEATAAMNQNSIGDRTEEKTLGETRLSRGGGGGGGADQSPLARRTSSLFQLQKIQSVRAQLVSVVFFQRYHRLDCTDKLSFYISDTLFSYFDIVQLL